MPNAKSRLNTGGLLHKEADTILFMHLDMRDVRMVGVTLTSELSHDRFASIDG